MITKYACGHVGTITSEKTAKISAFIRWAETRGQIIEQSKKNCPDCGRDSRS